ncbi:MAG TPA: folylpolyglutamate synthase/dihydrofolate synthase family protein [Candidatus Dormibacteraeota bacterium]|nr:folylpolyglutamate synthase/dihydrofolate synthase family protein [Candidatus Dormibacteraeota bacterium]
MNYAEAVRYLLTLGRELAAPTQPIPAKFDLATIRVLTEHLGNPHCAYPCIHIAGTNGKGSTAAMLESILRAAGLRTGLYTSPHLERINERIRIAGESISDDEFAAAFTRLHELIEELLASGALRVHPTYFECLTAMAFSLFAKERLDFAVIEVGLGGRFDATNVVVPEVAVITQIDFDHENFLGHSIEEIATEKAGILKAGVPVVSAAERAEARSVITRFAKELGCRLVELDAAYEIETKSEQALSSRARIRELSSGWTLGITVPLPGRFQLRNALTAVAAARLIAASHRPDSSMGSSSGFPVGDAAISRGLSTVHWPGRLERLQEHPSVYLDGAHNPAGARELAAYWDAHLSGRRIHLVYGALRDKAVDEVAGILFSRASSVVLTQPPTPRAISARLLAEMTDHFGAQVHIVVEPEAALERAMAVAAPNDVIFVAGSLYLVGALRRYWFARIGVAKL